MNYSIEELLEIEKRLIIEVPDDMSTRAKNALHSRGIFTVCDLLSEYFGQRAKEFNDKNYNGDLHAYVMRFRSCGTYSSKEIVNWVDNAKVSIEEFNDYIIYKCNQRDTVTREWHKSYLSKLIDEGFVHFESLRGQISIIMNLMENGYKFYCGDYILESLIQYVIPECKFYNEEDSNVSLLLEKNKIILQVK